MEERFSDGPAAVRAPRRGDEIAPAGYLGAGCGRNRGVWVPKIG